MRYDYHRSATVDHLLDALLALLPEKHVAYAEHLVQNKNFRRIPCVWIEKGKMRMSGSAGEVCEGYRRYQSGKK